MAKKALVVSGGGSRGAFAVGAIKAVSEQFPGLSFDILVGTSTGSLIVPLVALGRMDLLLQLYTSVHTNDIVLGGNLAARLLNDISLFDASPLGNLIKTYYNDTNAAALFSGGKELFICTTCLQTSETVVFATQAPPASEHHIEKLASTSELRRAIFASTNQPVFMQPIEVIAGANPVMQFVDGGVREVIGIEIALDAGADEILAISLAQPKEANDGKVYEKAIDILFKTLDIYSLDVGTNNVKLPMLFADMLDYLQHVKGKMLQAGMTQPQIEAAFNIAGFERYQRRPVKIRLIHPNAPLGGGEGGLQFDPAEMQRMVDTGHQQMMDYLASLPPDDKPFA